MLYDTGICISELCGLRIADFDRKRGVLTVTGKGSKERRIALGQNCLRADGSLDQQFVAQGVNPIAFTDDGRLFVALAFFGDDLFELDPALVTEPRLVMEGEGDAPWPNQLNPLSFGQFKRMALPR